MRNVFPKFLILPAIISVMLITSCSDSATNSNSNLKTDIAGKWSVIRTLVTPSKDFPNGYKDVQDWSFTVNGENASLTTKDGTINGKWTKSSDFNYDHWVFDAQGSDPLTGLTIKIVVEIIAVNKLKGTNSSYYYDSMNNMWLLLDSFTIEGTKK